MEVRQIRDTVLRSQRNQECFVAVWTEFGYDSFRDGKTFFDMCPAGIDDDEDCYIGICFEI